jgi:hypothetical protein
MKALTVVLLAAFCFPGVSFAEPAQTTPLFGSWAVDTARLPIPLEARPKSVIISFAEDDSGHLMTRVKVIDPTGATLLAEGVTPLDGAPTPIEANFEADVSATTMPTPDVLIMQLAKDGVPASTRIYTVAADGQTMIETVAYFGPDGQPVSRKNYFSRVQ